MSAEERTSIGTSNIRITRIDFNALKQDIFEYFAYILFFIQALEVRTRLIPPSLKVLLCSAWVDSGEYLEAAARWQSGRRCVEDETVEDRQG